MLGLQVGSEVLGIGAGVPIGVSAAILIGGTNDMTTNQKMGARWEVRGPDGIVVDSYEDWELLWTGPGLEQGFVGNQFSLNKLGTYTVKADLLMNLAAPVVVDSYDGDLCVVTPELPPEYELVYTHDYPDAATYVGKAEVCPFTFVSIPEQIPGHEWLAEQIAKILGESMIEHGEGSKMLRLQLWSDTSAALYTKYYGEATATASPVPWALVIGAIAIIAVIISFIVLIDKVKTIDWGEIPVAIPWAILAAVVGLGVLGVGAAVALAGRPKE
ncbi:hypothetical protein ES703_36386 [subsurface metagenome]